VKAGEGAADGGEALCNLPDLLPGTSREIHPAGDAMPTAGCFSAGPALCKSLVLADEINRASPKDASALA
jgi:hypothetical protein